MDSKRLPEQQPNGRRGRRGAASPELKAFITWAVVATVLIILTLMFSMHRAT